MSTLIQIPFHGTAIHALSDEGKPLVSLRHACEAIGVDPEGQRRKLKEKTWARAVLISATGSDGKTYQMTMIDRRTLTMWLATIEASRVKPEARAVLEAFQNEAADALDSYFHDGGAINPNATTEQLTNLEQRAREARAQAEVVDILRGILPDKYLENKSRIILARAMGEIPEIAPEDMPLIVEDYLKSNGLKGQDLKSVRSTFGRRVSKAFLDPHGTIPPNAPAEVGGRTRSIKHYTEVDRHLFDSVWNQFYADVYEPSLMDEIAS